MNFFGNKNVKISKVSPSLIPYKKLLEDGILENNKGCFSQTFKVKNVCEEVSLIKLLKYLDYHNKYQFLFDIYDGNIDIYLTESIKAKNLKEAKSKLLKSKQEMEKTFEDLEIEYCIMNFEEKTKFLHDFYRYKSDETFEHNSKMLKRNGKKAKALIAPYSLKFEKKHFKMDNIYGKVSALRNVNISLIEKGLLMNLVKLNQERILLAINFKPINEEKVLKILEENLSLNFKTDMFIPYQFRSSISEVIRNLKSVISNNEQLFLVNCTFINLSDNIENLKVYYQSMKNILEINNYRMNELINEQKHGVNNTLFFGNNDLQLNETLNVNKLSKVISF